MANQKRILVISEEQYHILINALNGLRNKCLNENISPLDVDKLLLHVINDCQIKGAGKENEYESR